jgi:isoleucyl-tRNA synthetase
LRLWIAGVDYRNEMTVSDENFKRAADTYRRLRNTSRFLLANLNGFEPIKHSVNADELLALDRWVVARTAECQKEIIDAYDSYDFHRIYQMVHNFCNVDLGSFYLDVIKDRQYTTQEDSLARRSCQTAMYYIAESLVRWFAPILSFTAEEIWSNLPGERGDSVFLTQWYTLPEISSDEVMGLSFWQQVLEVREAVSKELEQLRVAGGIGSSLDAEVDLYCGTEIYHRLSVLEDELRFVLITSYARLHRDTDLAVDKRDDAVHVTLENGDEIWVAVSPSAHSKCTRCWHHREDVGVVAEHPLLCARCVENVDGHGEQRHFA